MIIVSDSYETPLEFQVEIEIAGNFTPKVFCKANLIALNSVGEIGQYNFKTKKWTDLPSFPQPLDLATSVFLTK